MRRDPDFSYINDKGKKVSGAAAFVHHVYGEVGGVANYNDEIGADYISAFIKHQSNTINSNIEKNAKKKRLKVI